MVSYKPRYSRVSDMIELAIYIASKPMGVTINDIAEKYCVSRRTAERMRDSLLSIFPDIIELDNEYDNKKHWGFINTGFLAPIIKFNQDELVNLYAVVKRSTNKELKSQLTKTLEKLKALNNRNNNLSDIENLTILLQSQGYAIRQLPQYKIDFETYEIVKNSIINSTKLEGVYHNKKRLLEPLGLIYGEKTYLIAREPEKGKDIYTYTLHKFKDIKLTDIKFKKGKFNLQEYANQSFGVYQSEILDVELEFVKDLAPDAKNYNFHPTQKFKELYNGNLLVNFKACGDREIIWHVFKWGSGCKINKPESLKETYKNYLKDNLDNY